MNVLFYRQMYQLCGDCQNTLAKNHLEYELDVENKVLEPIQSIVDVSWTISLTETYTWIQRISKKETCFAKVVIFALNF